MKIKALTLLSMCLLTTLTSCSSYVEVEKLVEEQTINNNVFNEVSEAFISE